MFDAAMLVCSGMPVAFAALAVLIVARLLPED
jgi:hypothetical protein